jgi:hypothetical protein
MAGWQELFSQQKPVTLATPTGLAQLGTAGPGYKDWRPSSNVSYDRSLDTPTANMARLSMYDAVQQGIEQNAVTAQQPSASMWDDPEDPNTAPVRPNVDVRPLMQHLQRTEPYNYYAGDRTGTFGPLGAMQMGNALIGPPVQSRRPYSPETNPVDGSLADAITRALAGRG